MGQISTAALAASLGCSARTVRRAIAAGRLEAEQIGKTWVVTLESARGLKLKKRGGQKKLKTLPCDVR